MNLIESGIIYTKKYIFYRSLSITSHLPHSFLPYICPVIPAALFRVYSCLMTSNKQRQKVTCFNINIGMTVGYSVSE